MSSVDQERKSRSSTLATPNNFAKQKLALAVFLWLVLISLYVVAANLKTHISSSNKVFAIDSLPHDGHNWHYDAILKTLCTESFDSEHFTIRWNPEVGDIQEQAIKSLSSQCERAYLKLCSDFSVSETRSSRITVYAYHHDLLPALQIEGHPPCWAVSGTTDGPYFVCNLFFGATHELLHIFLIEHNVEPTMFSESYDRYHWALGFYAHWIDELLFWDEMVQSVSQTNFRPSLFLDTKQNDIYLSALEHWWEPSANNPEVDLLASITAFKYLESLDVSGDLYPKLLKGNSSRNFPWSVIGLSSKAFRTGIEQWISDTAPSGAELIESKDPNSISDYEYYCSLSSIHYPTKMKLGKICRYALLSKFNPAGLEGVDEDQNRLLLEVEFPRQIVELITRLSSEEREYYIKFLEMLAAQPSQEQYGPNSEFAQKLYSVVSPGVISIGRNLPEKVYAELLRRYLYKRPLDLEAMKRFLKICDDGEKEDVTQRMLNHPSVKLSQKAWEIYISDVHTNSSGGNEPSLENES